MAENALFSNRKPVIGTVHLLPLPGSMGWSGRPEQVMARAEQEALALASAHVDAILLENFYDAPYSRGRVDVAAATALALAARHIQELTGLPVGVSVLRNDPETALAVVMHLDPGFIRVPVLMGASISETGLVEGRISQMKEYLSRLRLPQKSLILADISLDHWLPGHARVEQEPEAAALVRLSRQAGWMAQEGLVDALIVSDEEVTPELLTALKASVPLPLLAGEGLDQDTVVPYYQAADGVILAHGIKKPAIEGIDHRPSVDITRAEAVMRRLRPFRTPSGSNSLPGITTSNL
jgi:membrane complex biogenesis BtpA family protein